MRQGRHVEGRHSRRPGSPSTWIAGAAALAVTAAIALSMAPAQAAAQTVPVQLTLSGLASSDNPTGGSVIGVHPGDSVVLTASALPTKGAPKNLDGTLAGLVSGAVGLQVNILSGDLPNVGKNYLLGSVAGCGGHASLSLNSLKKGTYSFKYQVEQVSLVSGVLGLLTNKCGGVVKPTQDQLGALTKDNVKVTDNAVYSGSIVVATNPPKGKIGVQLPSQSISVKAGPISTSVNVPGLTAGVDNPLPAISSALNSVVNKIPGVGTSSTGAGGTKGSGSGIDYTPPALTVPQQVMPHAVNVGGAGGSGFAGPGSDIGGVSTTRGYTAPAPRVTSTAGVAEPSSVAKVSSNKNVDGAAKNTLSGQQLPVLLAIVSILALAMVTGVYARLYLLRR